MNPKEREIRRLERSTKFLVWMASKSSKNKTWLDKLCRLLVNKVSAVHPDDDFLRDPLIDEDKGFDPDELDRFQRGEQ